MLDLQSPDHLFEMVAKEVLSLVEGESILPESVDATTSLTEDLGFDSLKFVDLTLALEDRLRMDEFPMQDWVDGEVEKPGAQFTMGSLVVLCEQLLLERSGVHEVVAVHG